LKPEDAFVRYRLGLALSMKGDVKGAIAAYQEALRLDPSLTEAREGLDRARKREGSKVVP